MRHITVLSISILGVCATAQAQIKNELAPCKSVAHTSFYEM